MTGHDIKFCNGRQGLCDGELCESRPKTNLPATGGLED